MFYSMAKIKQGILGGFSGSVANVVGTSWKGTSVMKSKPVSVSNPNTDGQQAQRTSFKAITQLASVLLTYVLKPVYNPIAQSMSGYNKYVQQNKSFFNGLGEFVPANALLGGGSLTPVANLTVPESVSDGYINVHFDANVAAGSPRLTDKIYGFAYDPVSGAVFATPNALNRQVLVAEMRLVSGEMPANGNHTFYIGLCPVSSDGRQVGIAKLLEPIVVTFDI